MKDLKDMTVEELLNTFQRPVAVGVSTGNAVAAFNELARRLYTLQEYFNDVDSALRVSEEEVLRLRNALEEAEQKIVAQQAAVVALYEALNFYAAPETWFAVTLVPDRPAGEIMEDFSETELNEKPGALARRICEKYENQSVEELSAHDAEIAAKALEEVLVGLRSEDDSTQLRAIISEVEHIAAEYRANGRKE